VVVPAL
jgi:hypothetical protein